MVKKYVLGIVINKEKNKVLLIRKTNPEWQRGLLNAIGGKIELEELPISAMVREFEEETGLKTSPSSWKELGTQGNEHYIMYIYYMFSDIIFDAKSTTEEEVGVYDIDTFMLSSCGVDNLESLVNEIVEIDY